MRRRKRTVTGPPESEPGAWFGQLVRLLEAHGFAVQPGDTPHEYALAVSEELAQRPHATPLSSVPFEWAEAYYTIRFGGTPVAPERLAELEASLEALGHALRL